MPAEGSLEWLQFLLSSQSGYLGFSNPMITGHVASRLAEESKTTLAIANSSKDHLLNLQTEVTNLSVKYFALKKDLNHLILHHLVPIQLSLIPNHHKQLCLCFHHSDVVNGFRPLPSFPIYPYCGPEDEDESSDSSSSSVAPITPNSDGPFVSSPSPISPSNVHPFFTAQESSDEGSSGNEGVRGSGGQE